MSDQRKKEGRIGARGRIQPGSGDRRSPGTGFLGKKLRLALDEAGIERRVTIYDLRRTFAVLLQEVGAPDSVIAQALGHSARGVTQFNYLPRRDLLVKEWVERIEVRMPQLESPGLPPKCHQSVAEEPPGPRVFESYAKQRNPRPPNRRRKRAVADKDARTERFQSILCTNPGTTRAELAQQLGCSKA